VDENVIVLRYGRASAERLDRYLAATLPEYSRSRLQALIRAGNIAVDDAVVTKAGFILELGRLITVTVPPLKPAIALAEKVQLDVLFENADVVVVDKPAGMVVHPAAGHDRGTLVNAVLAHAPGVLGVGGVERPGIVHRLDKDTSGIILVAKNDRALRWLQDEFRSRRVDKTYLALVDGAPPAGKGRVDAPIGRDPRNRKRMSIVQASVGREATSIYRIIEAFQDHTLLEVHPLTGRTHQIRLHCAFLKCPVAGDAVYGRKRPTLDIGRQFLHAAGLLVRLPGENMASEFKAPLPPNLVLVLDQLRSRTRDTRVGDEVKAWKAG
jgi:23S rRNA pseudouridine1911/1915/1917 synthase